ncbi:MAG TPA: helix-turn-helix domain-containing protein [Armatimonadota bacterium]|nr:helix-turn-helix domain-containing protein [Armatimonadota bacterium]
MGNYDAELGEWLKYVQQYINDDDQEEQKQEDVQPQQEVKVEPKPVEQSDRLIISDRLGRVLPEDTREMDSESVIADSSLLDRRMPEHQDIRDRGSARLFEDSDVPDVEDYLPFLKEPEDRPQVDRSRMPEPKPEVRPAPEREITRRIEPEVPFSDPLLPFSEGTGEPKPVIRKPEPVPVDEPVQPVKPVDTAQAPKPVSIDPVIKQPQIQPQSQPQSSPEVRHEVAHEPVKVQPVMSSAPSSEEVQEMWDKLPRHIQLLMGQAKQEVAQHSYKQFKETREELIARLLDPTLSLEETARILNVCPTTVRRYTNRGVLRHIRTVGNQRRFRLSDVLAFLESQTRPTNSGSKLSAEIEN